MAIARFRSGSWLDMSSNDAPESPSPRRGRLDALLHALGHAATQYYAQGRSLSTTDLKALFARFQTDATTMYPTVQGRIATLAQGTNLASIMKSVTG